MGLDKIVVSILTDSRAKEQAILSQAEAEARALIEEASRSKARVLETYRNKADETADRMRERQEAGLEVEVKKHMLSARKKVLDESFKRVLEHFGNLPENSRRRIYSALRARLLAEFGSGTIHCREGEEHLFTGIPGFSVGQPIETIGGFLAENGDRTLVADMRFEMLVKDMWDRHLNDISSLLFREEDAA